MLRQGVDRTYKEWRHWNGPIDWVLKSPTPVVFITEREYRKLMVDLLVTTLSGAPHKGLKLQGTSKRLFPGCVKSGEKVTFGLPTSGRQTQFFYHIFSDSQPGEESFRGSLYKERNAH